MWRDRQCVVATRALPSDGGQIAVLAIPDHVKLLEEREYRKYLVSRALSLMQADFKPVTWKTVWEHAVQRRPAAEVAAELGLSAAAVACGKFRVVSRLRQRLRVLFD